MYKHYFKTTEPEGYIKVETVYNVGGQNLWTDQNEMRGYYAIVTPVKRSVSGGITTESFVAFTGKKWLIQDVERRSKKMEALADAKVAEKALTMATLIANANGEAII